MVYLRVSCILFPSLSSNVSTLPQFTISTPGVSCCWGWRFGNWTLCLALTVHFRLNWICSPISMLAVSVCASTITCATVVVVVVHRHIVNSSSHLCMVSKIDCFILICLKNQGKVGDSFAWKMLRYLFLALGKQVHERTHVVAIGGNRCEVYLAFMTYVNKLCLL